MSKFYCTITTLTKHSGSCQNKTTGKQTVNQSHALYNIPEQFSDSSAELMRKQHCYHPQNYHPHTADQMLTLRQDTVLACVRIEMTYPFQTDINCIITEKMLTKKNKY